MSSRRFWSKLSRTTIAHAIRILEIFAASTKTAEKRLRRVGIDYECLLMRLRKVENGGKTTGFLVLFVLRFRADYQMSTKSSNSLQVEDIVLYYFLYYIYFF